MKKWVFGCAMALVITSCDNKKFSIQSNWIRTVGLNSSIMLRSILSFIN